MNKKLMQRIARGDGLERKAANIMAGYARGYYTWLAFEKINDRQCVKICMAAKEAENSPDGTFYEFQKEMERRYTSIISIIKKPYSLEIVAKRAKRDSVMISEVTSILDEVWSYMNRNDFTACCERCGENMENVYFSRASAKYGYRCTSCLDREEMAAENSWMRKKLLQPANIPLGIVGALLGMICSILLAYFLRYIQTNNLQTFVPIVLWYFHLYISITFLYTGYFILAKGLDIPGLIICGVLQFISLWSIDMAGFLSAYGGKQISHVDVEAATMRTVWGCAFSQAVTLWLYFENKMKVTVKVYD